MSASQPQMIEIVGLAKQGGPLTKTISLNEDGKVVSDGSACVMGVGKAKRFYINNLPDFADLIGSLDPNEAIALGRLRVDLPDEVTVITQEAIEKNKVNGTKTIGPTIARNAEHIIYDPGKPALGLLDVDTKGMPADVADRVNDLGGFWNALVSVLPELAETKRVVRPSTSSGLFRTDTSEAIPGSSGLHIFLVVTDGSDVPRFLKTLHERCWLAGFGWLMVGEGGQLLERSIVDRMVGAAERLVFEAAPTTVAPIAQDPESRKPQVFDGTELDTKAACPPLRIVEQADLKSKKSVATHALAPERARARETFVAKHATALSGRVGITNAQARHIIARQCDGTLLPDVILPWDDAELAGCTVADVLKDPSRFVGSTLADPLAGLSYGRCKAIIMQRADGTPWVHSFAHGRTRYELMHDAKAVNEAVTAAPVDEVANAFIEMAINADIDEEELESIRNRVAKITGVTKRAIQNKLKARRAKLSAQVKQEERDRRAAERQDPRPQILVPFLDAEWLPQVQVINERAWLLEGTRTTHSRPGRVRGPGSDKAGARDARANTRHGQWRGG